MVLGHLQTQCWLKTFTHFLCFMFCYLSLILIHFYWPVTIQMDIKILWNIMVLWVSIYSSASLDSITYNNEFIYPGNLSSMTVCQYLLVWLMLLMMLSFSMLLPTIVMQISMTYQHVDNNTPTPGQNGQVVQTIFSNAFSSKKIFVLWFWLHWNVFLKI